MIGVAHGARGGDFGLPRIFAQMAVAANRDAGDQQVGRRIGFLRCVTGRALLFLMRLMVEIGMDEELFGQVDRDHIGFAFARGGRRDTTRPL